MWMQELSKFYCRLQADSGCSGQPDGALALCPLSHAERNVQLIIRIGADGRFLGAEKPEEKMRAFVPVTDESACRTSGISPHPLDDVLDYCCGGFSEARHGKWKELLGAWCASKFAHPLAKAVLACAERGGLKEQLEGLGLLDGVEKPNALFAVWEVETGVPDADPRTWLDQSLRDAWTAFDMSSREKRVLCYASGSEEPAASLCPTGLRYPGDKAKLITSNDMVGFTYRGMFANADQACTLGCRTQQQAMLALTRLLHGSGCRFGDGSSRIDVVAWTPAGQVLPDLFEPQIDEDEDVGEFCAEAAAPEQKQTASLQDAEAWTLRLGRAARGWKQKLEGPDPVCILGIGAASTGRAGVAFYRETPPDELIAALEAWQRDFAWRTPFWKTDEKGKKKKFWSICAPTPRSLASAAYGRGAKAAGGSVFKQMLPCIIDGWDIPGHLLEACLRRAANPAGLDTGEWKDAMAAACALARGHLARSKKEKYGMALDRTSTNRSYLFGRLLGMYDVAESVALSIGSSDKKPDRPTNAVRMMSFCVNRPWEAVGQLRLAFQPYEMRLIRSRPAWKICADQESAEIAGLFELGDFSLQKPLEQEWVLGFECQRTAMYEDMKRRRAAREAEAKAKAEAAAE